MSTGIKVCPSILDYLTDFYAAINVPKWRVQSKQVSHI